MANNLKVNISIVQYFYRLDEPKKIILIKIRVILRPWEYGP